MFQIQLNQITREMLLEHHSEAVYMATYLGIPVRKGLFRSPLRSDHRPTCAFHRNEKTNRLMFKDFGNGFYSDFVGIVMHIYKVNYYMALRIIAHDFDILPDPDLQKSNVVAIYDNDTVDVKEPTVIQVKIESFTKKDLDWWNQFGITPETLNYYKVYRAEHVFLNGQLISSYRETDPSYAYFFGFDEFDRELWKIYYPFRKKARFLLNCSVLQGADQLPLSGDWLVITKSLKDVMSLYELGVAALAPQGESIILSVDTLSKFRPRFKQFVFNGDWDPAGKNFMIQNRKLHGGICLSFTNKELFGKDISDYIQIYSINSAKQLIKSLKKEYHVHLQR